MSPVRSQRHVRGVHGDYQVVGDAISKGGVGSIFRTTDPKWVYKEYHSPDKAPPNDLLQRLVDIGRDVLLNQGQQIGSRPESSVNWPVDIVRRPDGRIIGCVLPTIPDRYFHPTHKTVNTLDFLVMRRASPPAAKYRMVVLLRMAEILAFVHSKGLVHGDVNAKNVAWALQPEPAAYLIDCDGMVPQDPPPQTGVQANFWTDPRVVDRVIPAHDHYSDWYCLALAFYRGLLLPAGGNLGKDANGTWQPPGQIPSDLDPRIAGLLRRALTDPLEPGKRPEPAEWVRTLMEVYVANNKFDDAALATLDRALSAPKPNPVQPQPTQPIHFQTLPPTAPPAPGRPTPPGPQTTPWAQPRPSPPPPPPHRPTQPARTPPPPPPPAPQPTYQQPTYPQPTYQQPGFPPPAPPPPAYTASPYGMQNPYQQNGYRPAASARWAMGGGPRWWMPVAILVFCPGAFRPLTVAALVVFSIVLLQTVRVPSGWPGRTQALITSGLGAGFAALALLQTLAA